MNFRLIFVFAIFLTFEVALSVRECVKRKSGACRVFNITEDFDEFISVDYTYSREYHRFRVSSIIEIDYLDNKYSYSESYNHNKTKKQNGFDIFDNPVVEILLSEKQDPVYGYRLVLGEKLNRLAYVDIVESDRRINYNNYSPDLPSWPFAINITADFEEIIQSKSNFTVYTKNGDGFDKAEPFLRGRSDEIAVNFMSIRSRNKNVKLVGFYDCLTKYGSNCGLERTQNIDGCREKFSPLGSGFFNNFVDMSRFNRLVKEKGDAGKFEYDEIFGIYRRNHDNVHILFTTHRFEQGTFIRITIGDEVSVHIRTYDEKTYKYIDKIAVKKGWHQEPSEPNFIKVKISSESKQISIHKIQDLEDFAILEMKLCNYFDRGDTIQFMSVTSDRFKTVDMYYDCCLRYEQENCRVYGKKGAQPESSHHNATIDNHKNISTNMQLDATNETDAATVLDSTVMNSEETTTETTETAETVDDSGEDKDNSKEEDYEYFQSDDYTHHDANIIELETLSSEEYKTNIFLDTSDFRDIGSTVYVYEKGTSPYDYCPDELANVKLMRIVADSNVDLHDDDDDVNPYIFNRGSIKGGSSIGLSQSLRSLFG